MLYAKAFAVGVVTGVLSPVVAGGAAFLWFWVSLFLGGFASYDIHLHDVHVQNFFLIVSPGQLVMQMAVGFAIGFLFTLWRGLIKSHETQ